MDGYENQRTFYDAKWMNEEKEMTEEIVGGNVFEFSTEVANLVDSAALTKAADAGKYGVGYFQPAACDNEKTLCEFTPYPEYDNLKKAYTTTAASTVEHDSYTPTRDTILSCPQNVSTELPSTPQVTILTCSVAQPICNGKKANSYEHVQSTTAVGEKRSPSNEETTATAVTSAGTRVSTPAALVASTGVVVALLML
ncbi:hypothetical protein PHYPSEUDO_002964 [Phytophthora pseudosyringae]|uniref:Uncharacterized protein n=1 Tax=Phytophthora pseudosyringae TaxID=221518 RepID=A0A8T1VVS1_9STRA|nr:hypothetical protein PHYPSEUDO_002964 [Phytophthora pseudosyringae]